MAVDVDFYAFLGVQRAASEAEVQAAVREKSRTWRRKTESSDLSTRQEAELMVTRVQEARTILLDGRTRSDYDRRLEREGVSSASVADRSAPASGGMTWLERAEGHLAMADYASAAYAAREATQVEPDNARAWVARSRASCGERRPADALYEAKHAVKLSPEDAEILYNAGSVAESADHNDEARGLYLQATAAAPTVPLYPLSAAGILIDSGGAHEGLAEIQAVYKGNPNDELVNWYLGMALTRRAEKVPAQQVPGGYVVASPREISSMRGYLKRIDELRHIASDVREEQRRIAAYLDRMEQKTFAIPGQMLGAGWFPVLLWVSLPFWMLYIPIAILGLGSAGAVAWGLILLAAGGTGTYYWWRALYAPRWRRAG